MTSIDPVTEPASVRCSPEAPAVRGGVRAWLHAEAAMALVITLVMYGHAGASWGQFAVLFLVPDLALLGYLLGARAGAGAYNAVHSYVGPLALTAIGLFGPSAVMPYALIWLAHCSLDRALGYGLKYPAAARYTHLSLLGRRPRSTAS